MAYSSPASVSDGNVAPASWGNSVKTAADYLANPPACRLTHSTTQAVTNNAQTTVIFNTERYDTAGMHDNVTNNDVITVPDTGLYIINAHVAFATATDYTSIQAWIYLNGTSVAIAAGSIGWYDNATFFPAISLSTVYRLTAGNTLRVRVAQINGAAASRNIQKVDGYTPEFSATWIGLG